MARTLQLTLAAMLSLLPTMVRSDGPARGTVPSRNQQCASIADKAELQTSQGDFRAQAPAGRDAITKFRSSHIRFDVGPGDEWSGDIRNRHGSERAELRETGTMTFGGSAWISFSQRIVALSQRAPRQYVVLGQLHGPNQNEWLGKGQFGPPPLALVVNGANFRIISRSGSEGHPTQQYVQFEAPLNKMVGQWHNYVIHVRLSGGDGGELDVWRDGASIVRYRGPIGYSVASGRHYWKFGIYRARAKTRDIVDYANMRFSKTSLVNKIEDPDPVSDDLQGDICDQDADVGSNRGGGRAGR